MQRALVIYNPAARKAPSLERLRTTARDISGWEIEFETTARAGQGTEIARRAVQERFDAAVACGGDGTVNEVINGLAGGETALAVVRGGTANVWAKEVGISRHADAALQLLASGEQRVIDLGRAGDRYFLLMAGVGFDATVVRDVLRSKLKRQIGAAAYILHGLRRLATYRSENVDLRSNGDVIASRVYWLLAGNTRSYGGLVNITNGARIDDGKLDIALLRNGGLLRFASLLPWVIAGRHSGRRDVLYRSVREIDIATPGLAVQIDGEYLGETPIRLSIESRALRVIVPSGLRGALFGEP
jgi:YegS/Rv2252/BmrU family lipid kinase